MAIASGPSSCTSLIGPLLPTWIAPQVVGYLGYTGRDADVVVTAAYDPERLCARALDCKAAELQLTL